MKRCFQVLFNHPLDYEDGVIYGFRVPCDDKAQYIIDYAVEELIGKWCFQQKHGGELKGRSMWIDKNGKIYYSGKAIELYSYTAALNTRTYFRVDEYWVDDDYDLWDAMITDPLDYFNARCLMEDQDYKTGYNGWLQVYQKLFKRFQRQLDVANEGLDKLDYDEQEKANRMSKISRNKAFR
jgi:hypothetical protein